MFVKNLTTGALTLVSAGANGQGNDASVDPSISADGSKVAFDSTASNLVAGDTNGTGDVFVKDLTTGALTRISTGANGQGNGGSFTPSISADGTKVAFYSSASNLVAGDTNNRNDVFVVTLATGAVTRVTTGAGGQPDSDSFGPSLSADGTKVAFYSFASNLVPGETDIGGNVFVKDLTTGAVTRVTTAINGQENGLSSAPSISADGTKVAFNSSASNLVAGDTNGKDDIFVKDLATGTLTRVSIGANGEGNDNSFVPAIFPDGSKVAFSSEATNLVAGDTNGTQDVFVKDLATGVVTLVSTGANGQGDGGSYRSAISGDGTKIVFESRASNLVAGDTNGVGDVFIKNSLGQGTGGANPVIGSGPDTLVLQLQQDAYQGSAQYTVSIDGTQVAGVQTASATRASGLFDTLTVQADLAPGNHTVAVNFLNDAYAGTPSTDRNLFVASGTYNGVSIPGAQLDLLGSGPASLGFTEITA